MAQDVRSVMTADPVCVDAHAALIDAARAMRDREVGDVLVTDGDRGVIGIVTDRDLVVRATASGADPSATAVAEVCSRELTTLHPQQTVDDAVAMMREQAVRRLPVVENGRPLGIVSLGDLAIERERESVLGQISAAPPNH